MSDLKTIESKARSGSEYARLYVEHLVEVLRGLDYESVGRVIDLFLEARKRGSTIFFIGNGGSAATSSHFANDLSVCASPEGKPPFRSLSLADNSAYITCLANDFGYESVFYRQLRNLMRPDDVVVGISASGNSPNVVQGLEFAAQNGGIPVAIVGFDGGKMKEVAKHVIHVQTEKGEYGPVEDVHMVLDHLISNYLASVRE
jgi:D-sedoheptulose 7-phosphate isomerase